MSMINLRTFDWEIQRFLNLQIYQCMLLLNHDIVLHEYMSNAHLLQLGFKRIFIFWIILWCFSSILLKYRYVADEQNQPKLQINAQNCLHCKVNFQTDLDDCLDLVDFMFNLYSSNIFKSFVSYMV
jgi:hypothetical protein